MAGGLGSGCLNKCAISGFLANKAALSKAAELAGSSKNCSLISPSFHLMGFSTSGSETNNSIEYTPLLWRKFLALVLKSYNNANFISKKSIILVIFDLSLQFQPSIAWQSWPGPRRWSRGRSWRRRSERTPGEPPTNRSSTSPWRWTSSRTWTVGQRRVSPSIESSQQHLKIKKKSERFQYC